MVRPSAVGPITEAASEESLHSNDSVSGSRRPWQSARSLPGRHSTTSSAPARGSPSPMYGPPTRSSSLPWTSPRPALEDEVRHVRQTVDELDERLNEGLREQSRLIEELRDLVQNNNEKLRLLGVWAREEGWDEGVRRLRREVGKLKGRVGEREEVVRGEVEEVRKEVEEMGREMGRLRERVDVVEKCVANLIRLEERRLEEEEERQDRGRVFAAQGSYQPGGKDEAIDDESPQGESETASDDDREARAADSMQTALAEYKALSGDESPGDDSDTGHEDWQATRSHLSDPGTAAETKGEEGENEGAGSVEHTDEEVLGTGRLDALWRMMDYLSDDVLGLGGYDEVE